MSSLTGKRRYRHQKFTGKLVVQVEILDTYDANEDLTGLGVEWEDYTYWRDAKIEDLGCLEIAEEKENQ